MEALCPNHRIPPKLPCSPNSYAKAKNLYSNSSLDPPCVFNAVVGSESAKSWKGRDFIIVEVGGPWFRSLGCLTCVYGCPGERR